MSDRDKVDFSISRHLGLLSNSLSSTQKLPEIPICTCANMNTYTTYKGMLCYRFIIYGVAQETYQVREQSQVSDVQGRKDPFSLCFLSVYRNK